jgi:YD repeat-containing protein
MDGQFQKGTFNTYDADNRVATVLENTGILQKTTTISYNDHGDKAEERESFTQNSSVQTGVVYSIGKDGSLIPREPAEKRTVSHLSEESDVHYSYRYDDHGNWTEQTTTNGLNADSPPTVQNRKLIYY